MKLLKNYRKLNVFLSTRSPTSTKIKDISVTAFIQFIFVLLFLIVFRPLFLSGLSFSSVVEISIMVSFIYTFFGWTYYVIDAKKINKDVWTIKNDIIKFYKVLFIGSFLLLIYIFFAKNYFYVNELEGFVFTSFFFIKISLRILFTGTLAYTLIRFIDYAKFGTHYEVNKTTVLSYKKDYKNKNYLVFYGRNKDEFVKTKVEDFLYLKSMGHYVKIFSKSKTSNSGVKTQIIRNSLTSVSKSFENKDNILFSHRSFIVNSNFIECVKGNSKKATLKLLGIKEEIPLSRSNYKVLKEQVAFKHEEQYNYSYDESLLV